MTTPKRVTRCAIYCRKSSDEGLEQAFNSLDAQRMAAEAYIASQASLGWMCMAEHYDDGGISGLAAAPMSGNSGHSGRPDASTAACGGSSRRASHGPPAPA